MPIQMNEIVRHLRSAVLRQDGAGMTDGQLVQRFIEYRDETAVEALVRRHGLMVWGVCRRVLGNHHDAEDAFQATFLVLVRKAGSVRQREMLGNWLYGVAHQTALKARSMRAKRRTREAQVADMPDIEAPGQDTWRELQSVLDLELSHLPDKYRVAIILCNLEGKTRREAARQLGLPEGTLAGRLTRGRAMLAKRLAGHGVVLSTGALWPLAPVPAWVMSSTIKAVTLFAAGQAGVGIISAKVAALTKGVLMSMLLTKIKTGTSVLLIATSVALAGSLVAWAQSGKNAVEAPDRSAKQNEVRKEEHALARTPPDLKEGARIYFADSRTKWNFTKDEPALVVRVQGSWVFLKGVQPQGFELDTGCWINFNNLDWYIIMPQAQKGNSTGLPQPIWDRRQGIPDVGVQDNRSIGR
jgi:RNA polymerase sigma factor (sigma-70 family)